MTLTILVSGPKATVAQARNVLGVAGFRVLDTDRDHGYPATVTGKKIREAQAFVTVEGDDVDRAHEVVTPLHWRLRAHWETPPIPEPSLESKFAALQAQVEKLMGGQ